MKRLAAVLLGILVGLLGPASGVAAFLLLVPPLPENPRESIFQLEAEVKHLRADLGVVRRGTVTPRQLADVESQVAALESRALAEPGKLDGLAVEATSRDQRIAALESKPEPPKPLKVAAIDLDRVFRASKTYTRLRARWLQKSELSLKGVKSRRKSYEELQATLESARVQGATPDAILLYEMEVQAAAEALRAAKEQHARYTSDLRTEYRQEIAKAVMPIVKGYVRRRSYDLLFSEGAARSGGADFDAGVRPASDLLYRGNARIHDITEEIVALLK